MATEAGSDLRCGIGARLRGARERAGMSILQAAERLHADPRVLEALEAERFDELGAAVFVRGHIRRYAELVRESSQELQDVYAASSHAVAKPDLTRIATGNGSRSGGRSKALVPALIVVIVIGAVGLAWWFLKDFQLPGSGSSVAQTDETSAPTPSADAPQPLEESSIPEATEPPPSESTSSRADVVASTGNANSAAPDATATPRTNAPAPRATQTQSAAASNSSAARSMSTAPAAASSSSAARAMPTAPFTASSASASRSTPTEPAAGSSASASRATGASASVPRATPSASASAPSASTARATPPASAPRAAAQTPPSAVATAPARPASSAPTSGSSLASSNTTSSPPSPSPALAANVAPTSTTPAAPVSTGGKVTEVTLRFNGDSWAEVYDAKGAKVFYDIGSANSVKTLSATPPLRIILGNPTGVAMEINGKAATVPTVKGENGVQFTVFRNGRLSRGRVAPSAQ